MIDLGAEGVAEHVVAHPGKGAHDGVADCIAENMVDGEGLTGWWSVWLAVRLTA